MHFVLRGAVHVVQRIRTLSFGIASTAATVISLDAGAMKTIAGYANVGDAGASSTSKSLLARQHPLLAHYRAARDGVGQRFATRSDS